MSDTPSRDVAEPRTVAGRELLDALPLAEWHSINRDIVIEHILAIEAEAAALPERACAVCGHDHDCSVVRCSHASQAGIDVLRLAQAIEGQPRGGSPSRPHWYFIESDYCDVGGHDLTSRERRYDPRPEKWEDRHRINHIGACYDCQYAMFA